MRWGFQSNATWSLGEFLEEAVAELVAVSSLPKLSLDGNLILSGFLREREAERCYRSCGEGRASF